MNTPSTAYWPVAYELRSLAFHGSTVCPETKRACDAAADHSQTLPIGDFVILPAAGVMPNLSHGNVPMSSIMSQYLRYERDVLSECVVPLVGRTFNTQGEAKAIASYVRTNPHIMRIVICVKWWHALRCYMWLYLYLKKFDLLDRVSIEVLSLASEVETRSIVREFCFAYPHNALRMLKVKIFG